MARPAGRRDATVFALREADDYDGRPCRVHAVTLADPSATLRAAQRLRAEGIEIVDVHSPFPIHGLEEALGWRESNLPWATFVGGLVGVTAGLALTLWTHHVSWPLNLGGKTTTALPAIVPVVFELGILGAALATFFGLLWRRRLWPRRHPESGPGQPGPEVTDDRFVILVLERDASFSLAKFREVSEVLGAVAVVEGWEVR
jgi:hypothetical protein